jgi:hypothetical protein
VGLKIDRFWIEVIHYCTVGYYIKKNILECHKLAPRKFSLEGFQQTVKSMITSHCNLFLYDFGQHFFWFWCFGVFFDFLVFTIYVYLVI